MDKLILIEGENPVLIQKEIAKIINKLTNYELIKYDLNEIEFNKIIEDLDTYDMFLKQKVIIGYNPLFLVEKTDFKEDKLLKYINNPSDNILILVVNKLNNRLKLVTEIKKVFKIITIKNIDYNTFIQGNKIYQLIEDTYNKKFCYFCTRTIITCSYGSVVEIAIFNYYF